MWITTVNAEDDHVLGRRTYSWDWRATYRSEPLQSSVEVIVMAQGRRSKVPGLNRKPKREGGTFPSKSDLLTSLCPT
jgi:hypothetical protein